jgi:hypothetical protein
MKKKQASFGRKKAQKAQKKPPSGFAFEHFCG